MPSYTQYLRQMSVVVDSSDEDITWITVKGNHIPIKKGQNKGDAIKEFFESKKSGSSKSAPAKSESKSAGTQKSRVPESYKKSVSGYTKEKHEKAVEHYGNQMAEYHKKYSAAMGGGKNAHNAKIYENKFEEYRDYKNYHEEQAKGFKSESKSDKPEDILDWDFKDVMKLPASDPRVHTYIAKNNGISESTVAKMAEAFNNSEDLYMEIDRISDKKGYGWDKPKKAKAEKKKPEFNEEEFERSSMKGMIESVLAYHGGAEADPKHLVDTVSYLKQYVDRFGEKAVIEEIKKTQSRIDRIERDVHTDSEGVSYNSIIWKKDEPKAESKPLGTYEYHTDPGHGWLKVPMKEIEELGLKISEFSYQDGDFGYLEEDLDAGTFMRAYKEKYGTDPEHTTHHSDNWSHIREMRRFPKPKED